MRLLIIFAVALGFSLTAAHDVRAEVVFGHAEKAATQMSEKQYSKQQREMEKQKQELLKKRAEENAKTEAGKKPENTYGGPTAGGPPPAAGPGGPGDPAGAGAPGGPANQQTQQQAEDEEKDENKTVIKRDEPEQERKSTNTSQHVNLGQPTKKTCSPGRFGVCSN